jgi:hypothetical protein
LLQPSQTTQKTKKQKRNTEPSSKYKVSIGGVLLYGVDDFISPTQDCPFWTFSTVHNTRIEATGNVIVEYMKEEY